jgi:hypothetical protein
MQKNRNYEGEHQKPAGKAQWGWGWLLLCKCILLHSGMFLQKTVRASQPPFPNLDLGWNSSVQAGIPSLSPPRWPHRLTPLGKIETG